MLKHDLILRNPLRLMGQDAEDILPEGGIGAVLARAGVGKTALLVQLAMYGLLKSRNVLHISLKDPVRKVCLWYEEVFRNIADQYDIRQTDRFWDDILPHRLIMTFTSESFSVLRLEERINELMEQDIFMPQMVIIDGFSFEDRAETPLTDFRALAKKLGIRIWFAVRIHRQDDYSVPSIGNIADLFDLAFQLQPKGRQIYINAVKCLPSPTAEPLLLDPSTMLISKGKL